MNIIGRYIETDDSSFWKHRLVLLLGLKSNLVIYGIICIIISFATD